MKIAVLDDYARVSQDMADWSGLGEVTVFSDTLKDEAALLKRLSPFDILCVMRERTPLSGRIIEALSNLKLIVTTGPKNQSIDLDAARARGITVCGTQAGKTATSELAMLLILALNRRLMPETQSLNAGGWQTGLGRDLAGLTLGLVGLGRIGAQMAALGRAFGMEVAAWSQNLTEERCAELGVRYCESLPALMAFSDCVSLHVELSERTRGLIDAQALAAMRTDAVLINTSRGPIVDTQALLSGLQAGLPAKAGLDVFDEEPLPDGHPILDRALIKNGRLLLTPHLGYTTETNLRIFYQQTVEAVRAWQAGSPVRVLVG